MVPNTPISSPIPKPGHLGPDRNGWWSSPIHWFMFFLQYHPSSKKWISRMMDLGIFLGKLQYFTNLNELRPYWDDFPIKTIIPRARSLSGSVVIKFTQIFGICEESLMPKKSIDHLERFGCHCHCHCHCPFSNFLVPKTVMVPELSTSKRRKATCFATGSRIHLC